MRRAFALAAAVLLTSAWGAQYAARAGTVAIEAANGRVTVDANDIALDEVLTRLGESQGFKLQVPPNAPHFDAISGRFEGPLTGVLTRLLHNESHMIIHSADTQSGIARIVLFGAGEETSAGVQAATPAPATPPIAVARTRATAAAAVAQPKPLPREVIPASAPQQRQAPQPPARNRTGVN
jgi:hypothetical protein